MTETEISNLLKQIEEGLGSRNYVYECCGENFPSLYEFRRHLHENHPEELEEWFAPALHREICQPGKEEIHKKANKGRKIKEKNLKKKEEKKVRNMNRDAYPTPAKGDFFRLLYTPMGNKK